MRYFKRNMGDDDNCATVERAKQFQTILDKRGITAKDFGICISRHACRVNFSPRNVIISRDHLKKVFEKEEMTLQTFRKGLTIIGLTSKEIQAILKST